MPRAKAAANVRTSRDQEQQEDAVVRADMERPWLRQATLEAPPPRPGYVQKWIRVSLFGKADPANMRNKERIGWIPRSPNTLPRSHSMPRISDGQQAGFIQVEGMILCERPLAMKKAHDKAIRDEIDRRTMAIDADIARANKENRSVAFGKIQKSDRTIPVREVRVQEDDE